MIFGGGMSCKAFDYFRDHHPNASLLDGGADVRIEFKMIRTWRGLKKESTRFADVADPQRDARRVVWGRHRPPRSHKRQGWSTPEAPADDQLQHASYRLASFMYGSPSC